MARGHVVLIHSAGGLLDGEVARRLLGRASGGGLAPYSTDDLAADGLRALVEVRGKLRCTFESWEGSWYCTWWSVGDRQAGERLASGSGQTRALAFCRASVNLPPWVHPLDGARPVDALEPRVCESCGSEERMRGRARAVRLCNVCSWKSSRSLQNRRTG